MIHVVFIFSQLFVVSMGMVSSKTVKCQQGWKGIKGIKKKWIYRAQHGNQRSKARLLYID